MYIILIATLGQPKPFEGQDHKKLKFRWELRTAAYNATIIYGEVSTTIKTTILNHRVLAVYFDGAIEMDT